ncbi:MAG: protein translocase subunit SecD [Bdellovibrionales bacterium]|nr:protein translocase subunit SecD [Bdellovibrionales bacterium]
MIESLRSRWITIVVVLVTAVIWMAPNIVEVGEDWWFSKNKIVYGLDIQGGLHLVLGVDVKGVIDEKINRLSRNIGKELKDENVGFSKVEVNPENKNELIVTLSADAELEKFNKFIDDFYPSVLQVLSSENNVMIVAYYEARILEYKKQVIDQAIEVIRNRIDEFGVSEPSISAQGSDRILVQLPGIKDASKAKESINRAARLVFRVVSAKKSPAELETMISEVETAGNYGLGKEGMNYSAYVKRLNEDLLAKLPENTRLVFQKADAAVNLEAGRVPYLIETDTDLGGEHLEDASVRPDENGKPEVVFRFTVEGRRKFAELTGKNVNRQVAIVLDDVLKSAPNITERIDSATARITLGSTGNYQKTLEEAQFIATALRAGALPAALEQLEERTVGPTLGADSIAKGKFAGLVGAILVFIFMLIYYRTLGVVADIALGINIFLLLSLLTSLGATLTLPGVAGIVLTVGMAVDANVIIFERIREELRKGSSHKAAIKDGFGHAFSAIFDANITTAVVCVVLMYFGTGPVRGFAVTLMCGIATSMFTAIFVSRTIVDTMVSKMGLKKLMTV